MTVGKLIRKKLSPTSSDSASLLALSKSTPPPQKMIRNIKIQSSFRQGSGAKVQRPRQEVLAPEEVI